MIILAVRIGRVAICAKVGPLAAVVALGGLEPLEPLEPGLEHNGGSANKAEVCSAKESLEELLMAAARRGTGSGRLPLERLLLLSEQLRCLLRKPSVEAGVVEVRLFSSFCSSVRLDGFSGTESPPSLVTTTSNFVSEDCRRLSADPAIFGS